MMSCEEKGRQEFWRRQDFTGTFEVCLCNTLENGKITPSTTTLRKFSQNADVEGGGVGVCYHSLKCN